jgi:threonine/homoserine/homoserine lactone efflux protein
MNDTIPFLTAGIIFGLTAGMSPGPLLTLVITETLKHNKSEGIKVAIAPLLTDIPIIVVTLFVLSKLANSDIALGIIAILGGLFLIYLGYESIKTKGLEIGIQKLKPQSIKKGIITNALSPHPYIFWLTVGAPTAFNAYQTNITALVLFIVAFYGLLVGSKIGVALIVDKSRDFLKNRAYIWTMRILGLMLLSFAILFVKDGLKFFGII